MLKIHDDFDQGSDEWRRARMGIPTASMFKCVKAAGRDGGDSKTRTKYMRQLAGEIITDKPAESYESADMVRGREMEPEARRNYEFQTGNKCRPVGFLRNGQMGASPDSLIEGKRRGLEIKTAAPHILIEIFEMNRIPPEHMPQLQGTMLVGKEIIDEMDIAIFWPGMPMFIRTVPVDKMECMKMRDAIDAFNNELAALVERIKKFS